MAICARCGAHLLTPGRFCTNCGQPIDQPVVQPIDQSLDQPLDGSADALRDTPARGIPRAAPVVPPPADLATSPRYALWADEAGAVGGADAATPTPVVLAPTPYDGRPRRGRRAVLLLLALAVVAGLVAGAWALGRREADPATAGAADGAGSAGGPSASVPPGDPTELAGTARVTAPEPGPPSTAFDGTPTDYVAANLVDGDPTTCWRTPGDATGDEIVLRLPAPAVLTRLALVNGYAKTGTDGVRSFDWYHGNRRVLVATWTFDDGTSVTQRLGDTREPQTLDLGAVTTQTVTLRLDEVSEPGTGPARRDLTAISEISLTGWAEAG